MSSRPPGRGDDVTGDGALESSPKASAAAAVAAGLLLSPAAADVASVVGPAAVGAGLDRRLSSCGRTATSDKLRKLLIRGVVKGLTSTADRGDVSRGSVATAGSNVALLAAAAVVGRLLRKIKIWA